MCSPGPVGSQCFPKSGRLRKRAEFQLIYEQGTPFRSAVLSVFCRWTDDGKPPRIGLTVSRRVGGAVVRNRVKRRLRELIRGHWARIPTGCEVVFHAQPAIRHAGWAELKVQVLHALDECSRGPQVNGATSRDRARRRVPRG